MAEQGMPGISIREKDGIKIITLSGIDFLAYITNPNLNNSGLSVINFDASLWKEYENGITTFSGCLTDQNGTPTTVLEGQVGLGFSLMKSEQIVAMSPSDAMVSHKRRQLEVTSQVFGSTIRYFYSDKFMEETVRQIENNGYHKYDEVASYRREQKLSKIQPGTYGRRIMPDYIYAYGRGVGDKGVSLAKQFGVEYILEYDDEVNLENKKEQTTISQTQETNKKKRTNKFIESIRKIKENEEYER